MTGTQDAKQIKIFDTTLRDGEQSPGASMTLEEKLRIAEMLEDMGVDVIEAGFPIASNGDFESVREVAKIIDKSIICGLARSGLKDIDRAWEALTHAKRPRIHTFISTSPVHMKHKLQMSPEEVLEAVVESVTHARNLCGDVEWSAEDATRTEWDFLCKCVDAAIRCGATTINIPDTVGYATPEEYGKLIADLIATIPNSDKAVFSTHCHNDLGLAVANSLAGIANGAGQIECTINGIGERAGNAALEEIVMALQVRGDRMPYATGVVSQQLTAASDQRALMHTDAFGGHDFIGFGMFEHPVLMDPRFMRKGVLADNRLVILHRETRGIGHKPRCGGQLLGHNTGCIRHTVAAHLQGHDDFFQRRSAAARRRSISPIRSVMRRRKNMAS